MEKINYEKLNLNNEKHLKTYLACELSKLNEMCPSNIFIHQIRDYTRSDYAKIGEQTIMPKIESILKDGFKASQYASIYGTMRCVGDTQDINVDNILNYNYYKDYELTAKIIFAFPKHVNVQDVDLEFSSYNGETDVMKMNELIDLYSTKAGGKPSNHHLKFCVLDAIKGLNNLPQYYILGILLKYHNKENYEFINPHTHLMYNAGFDKHNKLVEDKIKKLYENHGNTLNDVILGEYKKDIEYLDYLNSIDI